MALLPQNNVASQNLWDVNSQNPAYFTIKAPLLFWKLCLISVMDICEEIFTDSTVYILHANLSSHFISSQLKIILAEPLLVHLIYIYQTNSQISQCLDTFSVIVLQIWFTLHKIALTNNSRFSLPFNSLNNNASLLHLLSASCLVLSTFPELNHSRCIYFPFFLIFFLFFYLEPWSQCRLLEMNHSWAPENEAPPTSSLLAEDKDALECSCTV